MASQVKLSVKVDEKGKVTRSIDLNGRRIRLTTQRENHCLEAGTRDPDNSFFLRTIDISCPIRGEEMGPIIELLQLAHSNK